MIIRYPTAFFEPLLPVDNEAGNVTYTCSGDPPREKQLATPRAPIEIISEYNFASLRATYGELAYTTVVSSAYVVASGRKQYEIGQLLDFTDDTTEVVLQAPSSLSQIRHDTNLLDLSDLGLTDDEIAAVDTAASDALTVLLASLNQLRQRADINSVAMADNQKKTNEVVKALAAVDVIGSSTTVDIAAIKTHLEATQVALGAEMASLVALADQLSAEISVVNSNISAVSQLVR